MTNNIKTLSVSRREDWRAWLVDNHKSTDEIWLIYSKRHTCEPRIPYNDAVEEAICFGWIDSIIKRIDENTYCQKFTPRRKKSRWSLRNMERARKMDDSGQMTEEGYMAYNKVLENPSLIIKAKPAVESLLLPQDIEASLRTNKKAYKYFEEAPPSYRRLCISWIASAKKPETRKRRITELCEKSALGEKIGMK